MSTQKKCDWQTFTALWTTNVQTKELTTHTGHVTFIWCAQSHSIFQIIFQLLTSATLSTTLLLHLIWWAHNASYLINVVFLYTSITDISLQKHEYRATLYMGGITQINKSTVSVRRDAWRLEIVGLVDLLSHHTLVVPPLAYCWHFQCWHCYCWHCYCWHFSEKQSKIVKFIFKQNKTLISDVTLQNITLVDSLCKTQASHQKALDCKAMPRWPSCMMQLLGAVTIQHVVSGSSSHQWPVWVLPAGSAKWCEVSYWIWDFETWQ